MKNVNNLKSDLTKNFNDLIFINNKKNLNDLAIGENGRILSINCNENIKRRLLDLGFVKGSNITKIFSSPFLNPCAYSIRGSIISIRNDDAKKISIEF